MQAWERACLDSLTADIFGFNAVQIGLPQIATLAASRMPHIWTTDETLSGGSQVVLLHDFAELPFASQSLDLVVLPHVLEFAKEPHQVLREVERVLIPEGQVIVCGFNPASLWGLRQMLGHAYLPAHGELISVPRLKDWLKLLNLGVTQAHFGCYALPFSTYRWLNRCEFLERAGQRWWPYLGAVYVVQAIKRQKGMTLIGPSWRNQSSTMRPGVAATNKSHKNPNHEAG
jgi:SAM-dependent methyltransferase